MDDRNALSYILNHVFLPPKLPQEEDSNLANDISLCRFVYDASCIFTGFLTEAQQSRWSVVCQMLKILLRNTKALNKDVIVQNMLSLENGGVFVFHVRAQNAAVILRRHYSTVTFEIFEVSPPPDSVMKVAGKLICSYPGPAIEVPLHIAHDHSFVEQLVSFLLHMDVDRLDSEPTTTKAGSTVPETRSTTDPRYITQLLTAILLGMGKEANIIRISKRIADDVCWKNARNPWRRSSLWLIIRVAIQTTVESSNIYKSFMAFFHADLLQHFLNNSFSAELIHIARVKTGRRVRKLGTSVSPQLLQRLETISQKVEQGLQTRWSEEQKVPVLPPLPLSVPKNDTTISLLNSRPYLAKILLPNPYPAHTFTVFHPCHTPRIHSFRDLSSKSLAEALQEDPFVALADFEFLVQETLDNWVQEKIHDASTCLTLESLLKVYISSAGSLYLSNSEAKSTMLLTIMELWVALDIAAVAQCPLLASYSPEIPASILDVLLLRRAKSIEHAARIGRYLRDRHSQVTCFTSIFSEQFGPTMFAVRYFQGSSRLQDIKTSIEREATSTRAAKRAELEEKRAAHASLTEDIASGVCECPKSTNRRGKIVSEHPLSCYLCKLKKKASKIRITVHEWPLPDHPNEAAAVIFELNCPPVFAIWRSQTYEILRDIGMHGQAQSSFSPHVFVGDYAGLSKWSTARTGRITFGSSTKSFYKSHYRKVRIPCQESQVCVNNGLSFKLYDRKKGEHVLSSFIINVEQYCTLPLTGDGLYHHLQYAVARTTHSHNDTIVNQSDCPINLNIYEHLAFSNLRCGPHLQWKNIARELRTKVLTFAREEVHTLLTQAAWQLGPLSADGSIREWHFELGVPEFGLVLIREVTDLLSSVEANWMEATTVKTIIYLMCRFLAATPDLPCPPAYEVLQKARRVTYRWTHEIVSKLQDTTIDDKAADRLRIRACEMAATCRATFDVDPGTHLDCLLASDEDVAILLECSIRVHDNIPSDLNDASLDLQRLLHRDCRLSHSLESHVNRLIDVNRYGLDHAISSIWPEYRCGAGGWQRLKKPNLRWLTTLTTPLRGERPQHVHFNILDGTLLVDGKALGHLPSEIVKHSTYQRIFGQQNLDVIPADMPGMDYATRSLFHDYQVFFALREGKNLVVRIRNTSGGIFELIPHDILQKDFPTFFSTEHVHWMNINSGEIEFRPLDRAWHESSQNWRLYFSIYISPWMVQRSSDTQRRFLIDIQSNTFQRISNLIRPLEYPEYLTVSYNESDTFAISIDLPRFRLSFCVNGGELESKNMQGMIIDNNQSIGTMIGLTNRLVLSHKEPSFGSLPRSRYVLIPHGEVDFSLSPDENHVLVNIDTRTQRQVTWYKYEIDSDLGLLVGSVNLTSRLYMIYLHALCSCHLPDPLTNQTGTNFALQELGAAASFSFQRLTDADFKLLRLIGSINPHQKYYPKHLRKMQTIEWLPKLPVLSQHHGFDLAVQKILEHARSLAMFEPKGKEVNLDYRSGSHSFLMTRAMHRNAIYYEEAASIRPESDVPYGSPPEMTDNGIEASNTSRLVYAWPGGLTRDLGSTELVEIFKKWSHIGGYNFKPDISLTYSEDWLHLDLPATWITLYDLCRQVRQHSKKFELVFSLAALAYVKPDLRSFIPILLAIASIPGSSFVAPPTHSSYNLADGFEPCRNRVQGMVDSGAFNLEDSPAGDLLRDPDETETQLRSRKSKYYKETTQRMIGDAVTLFMCQWPTATPNSPFNSGYSLWFDTATIVDNVREYFASCSRNANLHSFISGVTTKLQENRITSSLATRQILKFSYAPQFNISHDRFPSYTLKTLLSNPAFPAPSQPVGEFGTGAPRHCTRFDESIDTSNLKDLISQFRDKNHSVLPTLYIDHLESSQRELQDHRTPVFPDSLPPLDDCLAYRNQCRSSLLISLSLIHTALSPMATVDRIVADLGLWPRIHARTLLHALASTADIPLSPEWAGCLTAFGEVFVEYQLSQRLLSYALRSELDNFYNELENARFNRIDAEQHPDWLLIQIQGNFITRTIQSDVAREMVAPSSNQNTVLQLNMGEGKSHVIVPLVAVALADSHKLVRVIVLKPLASQMFHLLVERISGLTNRRIYYLPFSRDVTINTSQVQHIRNLFEECARVRGVLVAQPEHILSFRLMVIDRTLSPDPPLDPVARELHLTQEWLNSISRDVLDESDEILYVKYQLIYTMDEQQPFDYAPDRWIIVQQIFNLVRRHVREIHKEFPQEVEFLEHHGLETCEGTFCHVRLLGITAAQSLISRIAEDALDGRLDNLPFVPLTTQPRRRAAILRFIKEHEIDRKAHRSMKQFYGKSALWKGLLLLRGLLAHGILVYVLSQRRWRVDYGLDLKRSLLAVPYRAKDMPSLRSEFGHPDVTICLTCLSYYYAGLTRAQVRECFDLLFTLDNPPLEYEKWTRRGGRDIPGPLLQLIGVNTQDLPTFESDIIPLFRHNQATIDFFLSQVAFPKEAREFPLKLGTSGWDLAEHKANFTTGFSGTNDNSVLLPTSIVQNDPVNQLRTNAQVLGYLLRPENNRYICTQSNGQSCSVIEFLEKIVGEEQEVRVLLDVGAQMLEMTNQELVAHWLSLRKDVAAGIFFDDNDTLSVVSQDGVVEPLYSSPFFQLLHQCVIYLDDAHTRGTDLKLPVHFCAVVTLGPKVTKDRLVQGCMRMRKLGHGQSVVFYAPPEVDRQIRNTENIGPSDTVLVLDVLSWVMSRTCSDIEHHLPHWIQQGADYHQRKESKAAWLQCAAQSLNEMYGPTTRSLFNMVDHIPEMRDRLRTLGVKAVRDARMEEEQEREVSHEVEQELQLERPPKILPAVHQLDEEVCIFVRNGTISANSSIFFSLFTPLHSESEMLSPQNPWSAQLLATRDFMTTTHKGKERQVLTDYLRPVNWIVSRVFDDGRMFLVAMSPYEVNCLIQDIRASQYVRLHMYAPRTLRAMKAFDDLSFYCIPPLPLQSTVPVPLSLDLRCQLNIWAGQLYLGGYEAYLRLCLLLGVSSSQPSGYTTIESDRFVPPEGRIGDMKDDCLFNESPLPLLKILFALRRKGMSYEQTHMGKILNARLLLPEDFVE